MRQRLNGHGFKRRDFDDTDQAYMDERRVKSFIKSLVNFHYFMD